MKFSLGSLVATPGALRACTLASVDLLALVRRHHGGDWGDLDNDDKLANDVALVDGARILSAYKLPNGERIWIITEATNDDGVRQSTCALLPSEY